VSQFKPGARGTRNIKYESGWRTLARFILERFGLLRLPHVELEPQPTHLAGAGATTVESPMQIALSPGAYLI